MNMIFDPQLTFIAAVLTPLLLKNYSTVLLWLLHSFYEYSLVYEDCRHPSIPFDPTCLIPPLNIKDSVF